jgi:tRNA uridine 5-carbamoylmethylation protein Kti12
VLLDKVTSSVINHIQTMQATGQFTIGLPGWPKKLILYRSLSNAEAQRIRRQFLILNKAKPLAKEQTILDAFVEYLNVNINS